MTEKREYATINYVHWQQRRIDAIEHYLENQLYGLIKGRIENFIAKHNGITETEIREKLAFQTDDGKINFCDWKLLCNTFQFMKKNGQFEEEHRGRGRPVIYRMKKAKL